MNPQAHPSIMLKEREQQVRFLLELCNVSGAHTMLPEKFETATAEAKRNTDGRVARHERIREVLGLTHEDVLAHPSGTFTACAISEIQRLKDRITSLEDDVRRRDSEGPPTWAISGVDFGTDPEEDEKPDDNIYGVAKPRSAYDRLVVQRETGESLYLDIYEILDAFRTENAALDHVVKKALVPGQRGHKDRMTDLREIEWSAKLARQQEEARLSGMTPAEAAAKPYADPAKDFAKTPWFRVGPEQVMSVEEARHCEKVALLALQFGEGAIKAYTVAEKRREEAEKLLDAYRNTAGKVLQSRWSAISEGEQAHKQSERMRAITEFARTAGNPYPNSGCASRGECRRWAENQTQGNPTMVGELIENVRLNQLPVVFTGAPAGVSRKDVKDLFNAFDIPYRGSVSVDTGFLVVAPDGHSSPELEAAEKHGVPILMWSELVAWAKAEAGK